MPTENEDMFTLQMSKLEIKYKDMSIETVNEIRDKVLGFIDSTDMRVYLNEHFKELDSADLINIIVGAPKPLTTKLKLMNELSTHFPRLLDEIDSFFDFEPYVQLYQEAIVNMQNCNNGAVYLLHLYRYDETDGSYLEMVRPFFSFDNALNYIKNDIEDWLWDERDKISDALNWFEIEKWSGTDTPELAGTYTLSKYGEVWDYYRGDSLHNGLSHSFGIINATGLYLPVPFSAGDVITIDCTPFAPAKHGVIVSVGDNNDCCCVQCMYLKNDGTLAVGALKHSALFENTPYISALYRAEICNDLPADEEYWHKIGKIIADWESERLEQADYDVYLDKVLYKVDDFVDRGITPSEFISLTTEVHLEDENG